MLEIRKTSHVARHKGVESMATSSGARAASLSRDIVTENKRVQISKQIAFLDVLVVDDDSAVRKLCCEIAKRLGFGVNGAANLNEARAILRCKKIDLLLLDLKLPDGNGLSLLKQVRAMHPETGVVVMTAYATVSSAVEAMQIGAGDYLTKPFGWEELTVALEQAGQRHQFDQERRSLRKETTKQKRIDGLIGGSPEMERLYRILAKVAYSTHPVLILGESGTGKKLVARSIHLNGPNAAKPFVTVDCGSPEPMLIETELFGCVRNPLEASDISNTGLLAMANGGTVYLDEIGELSLGLQAKLLRALQQKEVRPAGSSHAFPISSRVLAATNRDLSVMVDQGKFRKDLYVRLNVVNLRVPPLRERRGDIAPLITHFLEGAGRETGGARHFSENALQVMTEYDWPGNVGELEDSIERACALSSALVLNLGDLPTPLQDSWLKRSLVPLAADTNQNGQTTSDTDVAKAEIVSIAEIEKRMILDSIQQLKGDKMMAAKMLGIGKTTLYRKLKEYGISEDS